MKTRMLAASLMAALAVSGSKAETRQRVDFQWKGATVYFLITDRFCNGDTSNDVNYGRINDYGSERMNAATFHGGDLAGLKKKAE